MGATLIEANEEVVLSLEARLKDEASTLPQKYRALFSLRNIKGEGAHRALTTALQDNSALFRHDVAFCMGQRQDPAAIQVLVDILSNPQEHPMVRHEAGEALGAIGTEVCLEPLRRHAHDAVREVSETCQLALQRIEHFAGTHCAQRAPAATGATAGAGDSSTGAPGIQQAQEAQSTRELEQESDVADASPYMSVDPTPALPASTPMEVLRAKLLDDTAPMFERYRALFSLRNRGGIAAVDTLGDAFSSQSALLKHEVAYVLGQMQDPRAVAVLQRVLQDQQEHAMVRHEAAEALGAIADVGCVSLLRQYAHDEEPIVADSCLVALDVLEYEQSGQFEYAETVPTAPDVAVKVALPACS